MFLASSRVQFTKDVSMQTHLEILTIPCLEVWYCSPAIHIKHSQFLARELPCISGRIGTSGYSSHVGPANVYLLVQAGKNVQFMVYLWALLTLPLPPTRPHTHVGIRPGPVTKSQMLKPAGHQSIQCFITKNEIQK